MIAAGDIPSTKVYEDEKILAFRDIAPMAPMFLELCPAILYTTCPYCPFYYLVPYPMW
jgi:histidine triad (HIT) family protein